MRVWAVALYLLAAAFVCSAGQGYTAATVPNPKHADGGYVSNPDGILTLGDVSELNGIIADIEKTTGAQIAVVAVQSIGDAVPKDFAVDLFKRWGIGQKGRDNGVLLLVVPGARRWEIEVGYGLEGTLPDAVCKSIGERSFPAHFKKGEYGAGLIEGVRQIQRVLLSEQSAGTSHSSAGAAHGHGTGTGDVTASAMRHLRGSDIIRVLLVYAVIVFGATLLAVIVILASFVPKDPYRRYAIVRPVCLPVWAVIFPIPFIGIFFLTKVLLYRYRNSPRKSSSGKPMRLLSDRAEDAHLMKGQLDEEKVKSVDYDVWIDDAGKTRVLSYPKLFSKYRKCPQCGYMTYFTEYDREITAATYSSSGTGERKFSCVSCGHSVIAQYTIPQKTRSSSSSSGSGGGSSSWGGGRSGGGGSGGSW
ncbi:MAG: TPM domain-containing protein [Spirochaetes bacterium]|nr:TPM domain-containing protein [Spirochaetota bacterium]